jgi:vacuolar protein sorting-associated protein 13A/C
MSKVDYFSQRLKKNISKFLIDLDSQSLQFQIWNGEVSLENLQIRKQALNKLDLPITVKKGIFSQIQGI